MKWRTLFVSAALAGVAFAESADKLLDDLISHPGSYSQVCDVMTAPADIPYRLFQINSFAGAGFSKANVAAMTKNRDALVGAVRSRLKSIDLTKIPKEPSPDPKPESNEDGSAFGCDPQSLNPLLLGIVLDLQMIEALPELLAVEGRLVDGIAKAKDDAKATPPWVDGWFVAMETEHYDETEDPEKRARFNHLFQARVAQRDLIMVMALLMREKSYAPYLATTLEKKYQIGIAAEAKELKLPKVAKGDPLPKGVDRLEVFADPITGILVRYFSPVKLGYTRESRDEVRAAAAQWIAAHP